MELLQIIRCTLRIFYYMLCVVNITCIGGKCYSTTVSGKPLPQRLGYSDYWSTFLWWRMDTAQSSWSRFDGILRWSSPLLPWKNIGHINFLQRGITLYYQKMYPIHPPSFQTISYKHNFLCCKQPHVSLNYLCISKYFGSCMHTRLKDIYLETLYCRPRLELVYKKRDNITICLAKDFFYLS